MAELDQNVRVDLVVLFRVNVKMTRLITKLLELLKECELVNNTDVAIFYNNV